jgi:hypothetical protein
MRTSGPVGYAVGALLGVLLTALLLGSAVPATAAEPGRLRDWASYVDGSHYLAGQVPDGAGRWVHYQRKRCATCGWKHYASRRADADGRFRFRIEFPRTDRPVWRYRGYAPAVGDRPRLVGRVWVACAREKC